MLPDLESSTVKTPERPLTAAERERRAIAHLNPVRGLISADWVPAVLFLAVHVPLAWLLWNDSQIATLHAWLALGAGLFALAHYATPGPLLFVIAYITGAEAVWRLTEANIFFEFSKYATIGLVALAIIRYRLLTKIDWRPIFLILLLLPGIFIMPVFDRSVVAFNLSGPIALAFLTMFCSTVRIDSKRITGITVALVAPAISQAIFAIFSTLTALSRGILRFGNDSNAMTSGGDGPNQVSTILGLAALMAFLYFATNRRNRLLRALLLALSIWFLAQGAFTFSRGGLYTAVGAAIVASIYLFRNRRARVYIVVGAMVAVLVLGGYILPRLDEFSGGTLSTRLQDTGLTGRDTIMAVDLQLFRENPLFGIGLGESDYYHIEQFRLTAAHTELTRLLAEHGTLGLLAILLISILTIQRVMSRERPLNKAYILSLTAWALATTLHSAMRMVAVGFTFGVAAATFVIDEDEEDVEGSD